MAWLFRTTRRVLWAALRSVARLHQSPPRLLQMMWYVHWYRWVLKAVVDSFRLHVAVDVDPKTGEKSTVKLHYSPNLPPLPQDYSQYRSKVYLSRKLCAYVGRKGLVKVILVIIVLLVVLHLGNIFLESSGLKRHVDPHAIRGYPYCPENRSSLVDFPSKYVCDFDPMPNPEVDVVIVTFVNSAWIVLAKNWMCSAQKVGLEKNIFLVSLDPGVCSSFVGDGIRCYEQPKSNIPRTAFGEPDYQKLVIERTRIVLKLLSCGKRVLLADADIVFLSNPLNHLSELTLNKDIVFQADSSGVGFVDVWLHYVFRYICGGFIYMKPTNATKLLWLSVLHYQTQYKWNDQAGLNICIRHHSHSIIWDTLDSKFFPNGKQFFHYRERDENNMIVHANHLVDENKIVHMVAAEVWCHEPTAIQFCQNRTLYQEQCQQTSTTPVWCFDYRFVCFSKYNIGSLL